MRIRALTFDLDDTLWPISPVIRTAETVLSGWFSKHAPQVLQQYDREAMWAMREEVAENLAEPAHDLAALRKAVIEQMLVRCGYPAALADAAFAAFDAARHEVALFDDVLPALRRLSADYPMATISNGSARIDRLGLQEFFRFSVFPHEVSRPKPHPEMFLAAADRFGLAPGEILHVGDDLEYDIAGAREAGFQVIWVNRHGLAAADDVAAVRCLGELADRLTADA